MTALKLLLVFHAGRIHGAHAIPTILFQLYYKQNTTDAVAIASGLSRASLRCACNANDTINSNTTGAGAAATACVPCKKSSRSACNSIDTKNTISTILWLWTVRGLRRAYSTPALQWYFNQYMSVAVIGCVPCKVMSRCVCISKGNINNNKTELRLLPGYFVR